MGFVLELLLSFIFGSFFCAIIYFYNFAWLKPERIRSKLRKQGITGPSPSFIYGNLSEMKRTSAAVKIRTGDQAVSHDNLPTIFPYFDRWRKDYGPVFVYSTGTMVLLYMSDPSMVKEITLCTSLALGKPAYLKKEQGALFGQGIMTSNGPAWSHQRKIIAPELYMDKVKDMVELMVQSAVPMLESWESKIRSQGGIGDIRINEDLRSFSADVISRACFGSSYSKGKVIFQRIRDLQEAMSQQNLLVGIPGLRYIPSKNNSKIWWLEREIRTLILKVVKDRQEDSASAVEKDLLKAILEGAGGGHAGTHMTSRFVVDNCKNIYFAGQETTAISASWTLMLLSLHPEWQKRVRAEVAEVCGSHMPDMEMLRRLKILTMVIHESMRLYPPAAFLARETFDQMKFGDIRIPAGTIIWVPIMALHQDPDIWGPDAHEFNPERFARGIFGACKHPHAYMPFGAGPRSCLGQNFAMVEMKVVVSLILSKFTFSLSPSYIHSPKFSLVLEPGCEMNLLMESVTQ